MCAMRNRFIRIMGKLYDELIKDYRVKEGLKTCINCGRDCPLPFPVLQPHQTHSASIACIDSTDVKPGSLEGIDALITDLPGMAIGVRAADCIPVLLYDTVHGAVGAVHSGWRGTVSRIAQKTVIEMKHRFGSDPAGIRDAIGPGIAFESFQVGNRYLHRFPLLLRPQGRNPMRKEHQRSQTTPVGSGSGLKKYPT